jgi:hypothetical protein
MSSITEPAADVNKAADVPAFARMVRSMFRRRGSPGDLEDVEQTAAAATLESIRRSGLPLRGHRRYHYQAAARTAGLEVSRLLSNVSFGEKKAKLARQWQDRTPIAGCGNEPGPGVHEEVGGSSPDARIRTRELGRATSRLWVIISRHVRRFPDGDRRVLELLLGIGGDAAEDSTEVAWLTGMSHGAIAGAVRRLSEAVQSDEAARRARRVMLEHMEDHE